MRNRDSTRYDRLAIRELVDAYAICADRRDLNGQLALFAEDAYFAIYRGGADQAPSLEAHNRAELREVFEGLAAYQMTTHFNGQSLFTIDGDRATGETYCMGHHLSGPASVPEHSIVAVRYLDVVRKRRSTWRFNARRLVIDWVGSHSAEAQRGR